MFRIVLFTILILMPFINCNDNSQVIESLDGNKITTKQFEKIYETSIDAMSRLNNIEKKDLQEIIEKDINALPDQAKQINFQFQKKNFYPNYRQMMMIKLIAEKSGFSSRQDIKEILNWILVQNLSQLYIQEQVEKKIKITDEEAQEECAKLREKFKEYSTLPLERCIKVGRTQLKQKESQEILPKVMERIKEEVVIKHNEKFDLDTYLNSKGTPTPAKKPEENQPSADKK